MGGSLIGTMIGRVYFWSTASNKRTLAAHIASLFSTPSRTVLSIAASGQHRSLHTSLNRSILKAFGEVGLDTSVPQYIEWAPPTWTLLALVSCIYFKISSNTLSPTMGQCSDLVLWRHCSLTHQKQPTTSQISMTIPSWVHSTKHMTAWRIYALRSPCRHWRK